MASTMTQDGKSSGLVYFKEEGAGPSLLLVHGLTVTGDMFEPVNEHFGARHRLIIPDLRGHGRSRGLGPPFTPAQMASDLAKLLDHLAISSTVVLGYSMGGAIAQQFAIDHPDRCRRLVLASTYTCNVATFAEKLAVRIFPPFIRVLGLRSFGKFAFLAGTRQVSKERADWLVGIIAAQDRKLMSTVLTETLIKFDSRPRLPEIKCPTLIVAGSLDKGDLHQAKLLHSGIAGSQLKVMDGADHALIWAQTEEFVRIVDEFING